MILTIVDLLPLVSLTIKRRTALLAPKTQTAAQNSRLLTPGSRLPVVQDHQDHHLRPVDLLILCIRHRTDMLGHHPLHHLPDQEQW